MKKSSKKIVAILLLAAFALWLVFTIWPFESSRQSVPQKPTNIEPRFRKEGTLAFLDSLGKDTLRVIDIEFADSPEEIMYGMMYRKSMDPNTGMLFLMDRERRQSFYMKNTYVSLDIIYINNAHEIVSIQERTEPLNERGLPSEEPASLVLEVKGGFCEQHGIGKGSRINYRRL